MKQGSAARTRKALIEAAAGEFDQNGYAGSSLARISKAATSSLGALTFHFPTKNDLAAAVRAQGYFATRAVVNRVMAQRKAPMRLVVELTVALAGQLEDEVAVRAAARLTREQPGCALAWDQAWLPAISQSLGGGDEACAADAPAPVSALATLLVLGADADIRRRRSAGPSAGDRPTDQLAHVWELALPGASGRAKGLLAGTQPAVAAQPAGPVTSDGVAASVDVMAEQVTRGRDH
ncbi:TetR family transcriptional regulator [Streptomyces violascens]|uniref:TetR family transcriptional regulator n=1 Tax=Streptomyces violascens TaxID=67381 RepID=UPI003676A03D